MYTRELSLSEFSAIASPEAPGGHETRMCHGCADRVDRRGMVAALRDRFRFSKYEKLVRLAGHFHSSDADEGEQLETSVTSGEDPASGSKENAK